MIDYAAKSRTRSCDNSRIRVSMTFSVLRFLYRQTFRSGSFVRSWL
jgi:hypothetical protein